MPGQAGAYGWALTIVEPSPSLGLRTSRKRDGNCILQEATHAHR